MAKKKTGVRTRGRPPTPVSKRKAPRLTHDRPLTPKQQEFLERYLLSFNATKAYRESHPGVTFATANCEGSKLLKHPRIDTELKAHKAARLKRYAPQQDNVMNELASLAFSNIRDVADANGATIPLHDLPERTTAAIKKYKSREINAINPATGETIVVGHLREVEMSDKLGALKLIGIEKGMFVDRQEIAIGVSFVEVLRSRREKLIPVE